MRTNYRNYTIYSNSIENGVGGFNSRVVLQKLGTSRISSFYPPSFSLSKDISEKIGTEFGRVVIDNFHVKN